MLKVKNITETDQQQSIMTVIFYLTVPKGRDLKPYNDHK